MTFIYLKNGKGKNCLKTFLWSLLNSEMIKRVIVGSAISLTVTNLEGSSKNCLYLFKDGRGKNCSKTFFGSPLKTKQWQQTLVSSN